MSLPAQIMLVDDEANIRLTLGALLRRAGYAVTPAEDGAAALALLGQQHFDLLLVDLRLPGMSGMELVAAARARQPELTIIVLTGHGSLDSAIEGLHHGIFDYLRKTSDPAAVIARVQAGLAARAEAQRQRQLLDLLSTTVSELRGAATDSSAAQPGPAGARIVAVGALQLDTWRQAATFGERALPLTPTEFRILLCLAEHVDTALSAAQLVRCAQGYDLDELEAGELIKPHIHHLRQKLEPDPSAPHYILTVRNKGYLLSLLR